MVVAPDTDAPADVERLADFRERSIAAERRLRIYQTTLFSTRLAYARYVETRELFEQTIEALAKAGLSLGAKPVGFPRAVSA